MWSEDGEDNGSDGLDDSGDGFEGFDESVGDDSAPSESWIWSQGACVYRCTPVGRDYHCEPVVCVA